MPDPITPDTVRALIAAAGPEDWRAINGVDDPDPTWGSFPMVVTEPSGAPDDGGDEVAIVRNRSNGDAAIMAASKRIALAYLDAIAERDRLREIADDSPPPADAGLLALANRTLAADLETVRAERDRLARVLRVEQGDDSAGNPPRGWSHSLDLTDESGAVIRHVWTGALGEVYGSPYEGWWFTKVRGLYRENQPFHETALEAMEAADRAGGSNV